MAAESADPWRAASNSNMPAGPGEQLLTTLFADVHYYFGHPAARPSHHRFDRRSYVYLFYNPASGRSKLEVANHAGTPHQDAFCGDLHAVDVRYSHLQPNLVSVAVNPNAVPDQSTWHLPDYNAPHEPDNLYKLRAVDIYLWTEKDAATFLRHLKNAMPADRLDVEGAPGVSAPHSEHRDSMSPVVQQLETTAIETSLPPRTASTVSAQSFPGPPTAQGEAASPKPVPVAYNPAAPAAPEPVQYREKTPPPPDDGTGTGLKAPQSYGGVPQNPQYASAPGVFQSSAQTTPQHAHFHGPSTQAMPGPPQGAPSYTQRTYSGSMPPPPAQSPPTSTSTPSFGPMAASTIGPASPPPNHTSSHRQSTYASVPGPTQFASYNSPSQYGNHQSPHPHLPPTPSAPPAYAGHTPVNSPGMPPPAPIPPYQPQPQDPPSGYGDSYSSAAVNRNATTHPAAYTGDMHRQLYRPTEADFAPAQPTTAAHTSPHGKAKVSSPLQNRVGKAEKTVGKLLSKLDKLY